ncbi:MAG: aldehyde dehydrogenase EutE, partial [Verrucomicrobia bacterium]|nr:aldehyde dehydrogenase EutE [Verrucomicrobiota bacterium]
ACARAQAGFQEMGLEQRGRIIDAMRRAGIDNAEPLARMARDETGMGRYEDKVRKNLLVSTKTPGLEDLHAEAYTGDKGLTLVEYAPFGVVGAVTPSTNPTSTIINNGIAMLAAGNTVVFNPHPSAKKCSAETVALFNKVITAHGGPPDAVVCVAQPTIESAGQMMKHPGIRLLVVTGGGGVVKAAMESGKRAICAGPGNPPVVVDETADIEKAARDIVCGASFDNNVICIEEKEVIVVASVADRLIKAMTQHDAVLIDKARLPQLEQTIFTKMAGPRGHAEINRAFIGKNAELILSKMGMSVPSTVRLGIVEVEETHPLLWTEQMMPILPITRVPNADYAIDLAIQMEGYNRHTFVMHSKNLDNLSRLAKECNASIFVKNGSSLAGLGYGGEGYSSFTIASPTGEGLTSPRSFSRWRRCVLVDHFRIV